MNESRTTVFRANRATQPSIRSPKTSFHAVCTNTIARIHQNSKPLDGTYSALERNETRLERNETRLERNETRLERNETRLERNETRLERNETRLARRW